jgi:DMSO/TMAO reductase YedYZ molybdopterin-dependent catalytic subunit
MEASDISRRDLLTHGSAALAGLMLLSSPWFAHAFPNWPGEVVLPWLDQPPPPPRPGLKVFQWEELDSWITANEKFFRVAHYNWPSISESDWRLEVTGLVDRPRSYTVSDLRAKPKTEVIFTLECSGNNGLPWLIGGIGNAKWAGATLAPILKEAGIQPGGIEVVFFGADEGEETVRGMKMRQNFARSMSVEDAMSPANLLCYEMNGVPLPEPNGFPVRLIVPGWYGIANVKWLKRIEVRPTRLMNRFMARDYVTIREEPHKGEMVWIETSVGRARLKSAPAKVARKGGDYRISGAAWGAPIARVEVQIDDGVWREATIDRSDDAPYAWKIWSLEWPNPSPGEHAITSRAIDIEGHVQPAMTDPVIVNKKTYWESVGQITRRVRIP